MMLKCVALAGLVASSLAFVPPTKRVFKGLKQSLKDEEPWFAEAVATNEVDKSKLDAAYESAVGSPADGGDQPAAKAPESKPEPKAAKSAPKASAKSGGSSGKQDFLEADPYWDQSTIPVNTYKAKSPFVGKVQSVKRIVGENATGETCHIIIDHGGKMPYWEGQSYGVVPPGKNPKNGKPHSVRLYSIASTRYGDDMTGNTGSLCVRRAVYWDPELGKEDPTKAGVCSNFLCDAKPGTELTMTGPSGKVMLIPEEDPSTDLIMVATGTGIAPYRGFMRRLFTEKTPAADKYKGEAWLFLGVANSDSLLYDDEFSAIKKQAPKQFRYDLALSREENNKAGGKMYIQDKMEEYAEEIFAKLDQGAHIYFCGLKGMMPGIQGMLESVAKSKGLEYDAWSKGLKEKKQWHVEVY